MELGLVGTPFFANSFNYGFSAARFTVTTDIYFQLTNLSYKTSPSLYCGTGFFFGTREWNITNGIAQQYGTSGMFIIYPIKLALYDTRSTGGPGDVPEPSPALVDHTGVKLED